VTVTKKSSVLGGHVYVVEETDEGSHRVSKLPHDSDGTEQPEVYVVDCDYVCDCRAGDFGNDCKHVAMADGSLAGPETAKRSASAILEGYLDKIREDWPRAQVLSLLPLQHDRRVTAATALACGVLSEDASEKVVIWGEHQGLLIRLYCFKDRGRYRRALRAARNKSEERGA